MRSSMIVRQTSRTNATGAMKVEIHDPSAMPLKQRETLPQEPALRRPLQHVFHGVVGPGKRDVIAVANASSTSQKCDGARLERTIKLIPDRDAIVAQNARELVVSTLGVTRIGA